MVICLVQTSETSLDECEENFENIIRNKASTIYNCNYTLRKARRFGGLVTESCSRGSIFQCKHE